MMEKPKKTCTFRDRAYTGEANKPRRERKTRAREKEREQRKNESEREREKNRNRELNQQAIFHAELDLQRFLTKLRIDCWVTLSSFCSNILWGASGKTNGYRCTRFTQ
jgi:hypothetical protein